MLSRIGPICIPHCQDVRGVGLFHMGDRTNSSGGPLTSARMAHRILINQYLFATHLVEADNLVGAGEGGRTLNPCGHGF